MPSKAQARLDEFAFILLAGVILIFVLMIAFLTPGSAIPIVEPNSISLNIPQGDSRSVVLNITGFPSKNVSLSAIGSISPFVKFSKNNFDVFGSELVNVIFSIPLSARQGAYIGKISVSSEAGSLEIPVSINVINLTLIKPSEKIIPLGNFLIIGPSKTLDYKENLYIEKSYFSERFVIIDSYLTQEELSALTSSNLQLEIGETNGLGNLIVEINGIEVFNKVAEPGLINIPINPSIIADKNQIKIKSGLPGWLFWSTSKYKIKSAKFLASFQGIFGKEFTFDLKPNEAANFDSLQIQFFVSKYSTPLPELFIEVNNQPIYAQIPPLALFNATFTKDLYGNYIVMLPGNNTLRFSFKRVGVYEINNAILKVMHKSIE